MKTDQIEEEKDTESRVESRMKSRTVSRIKSHKESRIKITTASSVAKDDEHFESYSKS